ncbi:MAG: hypothetical protein FWH29_08635 [Methanobrevibacter sp.]|nr:hypothetical protein [Methanobrevibacter sp.]
MENKELLLEFIYLLKESIDFCFDINKFEDRIKLQKYVFIGKFFGLKHNYKYNMYIRGPYSSNLADDYYELGKNVNEPCSKDLNFNTENFSALVKNKEVEWLESATTMLSLYSHYKSNYKSLLGNTDFEKIIKDVSEIKHLIPENFIKQVCYDLKDQGLLN